MDQLLDQGVSPKILFYQKTIYQILKTQGVESFCFVNHSYAQSSYSRLSHRGSSLLSFRSLADLLVELCRLINQLNRPAFITVYLDFIDEFSHHFGPQSLKTRAQLSLLNLMFIHEFLSRLNPGALAGTYLILTADHGHTSIDPQKTIYLNRYPKVIRALKTFANGQPILPSGGPRDLLLFVKPTLVYPTFLYLQKLFHGKARVFLTAELIKQGYFGLNNPSRRFLRRVGDIIVLPQKDLTVWYHSPATSKIDKLGHHGGLSRDEVIIPFVFTPLNSLL